METWSLRLLKWYDSIVWMVGISLKPTNRGTCMEKVKYIDSGTNEPREQKKMPNLCLVTKPSSLACKSSDRLWLSLYTYMQDFV
jgi:hypothetical protein